MHAAIKLWVFLKQPLYLSAISQVHADKGDWLADNLGHPPQTLLGGVDQVICNQNCMSLLDQLNNGVAADVSGTSRD